MSKKQLFKEAELAALAKRFRVKSGKSKAALAREFGVNRATIQLAEEYPERSMTSMRCRIIEACSPFEVMGPSFWLKKRLGDGASRASVQTSS